MELVSSPHEGKTNNSVTSGSSPMHLLSLTFMKTPPDSRTFERPVSLTQYLTHSVRNSSVKLWSPAQT